MIFSDKTGTLTMNKMEFKKCSIAGIKYCEPSNVSEKNFPGICPTGIHEIKRILTLESKSYNQN
jgi:magnesium-transporting ATPase (P-type)